MTKNLILYPFSMKKVRMNISEGYRAPFPSCPTDPIRVIFRYPLSDSLGSSQLPVNTFLKSENLGFRFLTADANHAVVSSTHF